MHNTTDRKRKPMTLHNDDHAVPHPEAVLDIMPSPPAEAVAKPAPALITEHEVVFGTAAALSPPSTRRWTRLARVRAVILAALTRIFVTAAADPPAKRRHYPPRLDFLENSRMAREMDRL